MEDYAGRFALVLALLWHASDPDADPHAVPQISAEVARNAWRLVDHYKANHLRVRAYLQGKGLAGAPEGSRLILNYLKNHPHEEEFTERDLTRVYPPSRYDRAILEDGLAWLAERHAIRPAPKQERSAGAPGRAPSPLWRVHPDLSLGAQQN